MRKILNELTDFPSPAVNVHVCDVWFGLIRHRAKRTTGNDEGVERLVADWSWRRVGVEGLAVTLVAGARNGLDGRHVGE